MEENRRRSCLPGCLLAIILGALLGGGIWFYRDQLPPEVAALFGQIQTFATFANRQVFGVVYPLDNEEQNPDLLVINQQLATIDKQSMFLTATTSDDEDRTMRWDQALDTENWSEVKITMDESQVYAAFGAQLRAIQRVDGALVWESDLSDIMDSLCQNCLQVVGDHVVVLSSDRILQGVNAQTGEMDWTVRLNTESAPGKGFFVVGDRIAVMDQTDPEVSNSAAMYILEAADGSEVHQIDPLCSPGNTSLSDQGPSMGSPVFVDGTEQVAYFIFGFFVENSCVQSWDLNENVSLWEERILPETESGMRGMVSAAMAVGSASPYYIKGQGAIYANTGVASARGKILRIDLVTGENDFIVEEEDHALVPIIEQDNYLFVLARRVRGSARDELWVLDVESETWAWKHILEATGLFLVDEVAVSNLGWTFRPTDRGVVVLQLLEGDSNLQPYQVITQILDTETGQLTLEGNGWVADGFWTGTTWTRDKVYLTIRNLYTVDLKTGLLEWEWPLSVPTLDTEN